MEKVCSNKKDSINQNCSTYRSFSSINWRRITYVLLLYMIQVGSDDEAHTACIHSSSAMFFLTSTGTQTYVVFMGQVFFHESPTLPNLGVFGLGSTT